MNNKVYQNKFAERTGNANLGESSQLRFDVLQISDNDYNDIEYRVMDYIKNSQTKKSKARDKYEY